MDGAVQFGGVRPHLLDLLERLALCLRQEPADVNEGHDAESGKE
jgi:hypothetical protein